MNRPAVVLPLVAVVTVLGAVGQTLLKHAINRVPPGSGIVSALSALLSDWAFYSGGVIVVAGGATWLYTLSRAEISFAMPFLGMGFVATMITSSLFLHESIGPARIVGTVVIVLGMALVARS
jgi:drug/metabolite transporter (DMT)-like permease